MTETHTKKPTMSAEDGLRKLIEGNERFMRGDAHFPTVCKETLADLARGQQPYATILGCSDSRVPPELIFDANFGELFVVRVAGNVISPEVMGSLQYAGAHLHTPLFWFSPRGLRCGPCRVGTQGPWCDAPPRIQILLQNILPGLPNPNAELPEPEQLATAVEANVRWSIHQILDTSEAQNAMKEGAMLVGAIYEIASGHVRFLSSNGAK